MLEDQAPWSYSSRAVELMHCFSSLIDLGTGGGERLLKFRESWPKKVTATENFPPNLKLATDRLSPFGVQVFDVSQNLDTLMPFNEGEFDLVLNRHSGFNPGEVARILSPGGTYLTQQMHGLSGYDLTALFGQEPPWPFATPEFFIPLLKAAGLTIIDKFEWSGQLTFTDVGSIVYYLKAVPWVVSGFSVETHLDHLFELQRRLENNEGLSFIKRQYLIEAYKKPK